MTKLSQPQVFNATDEGAPLELGIGVRSKKARMMGYRAGK